jgi:glycolate oxidase iron-sulfur subunit
MAICSTLAASWWTRKVPRPASERALRWALKEGLSFAACSGRPCSWANWCAACCPRACKTRCRCARQPAGVARAPARAQGAFAGRLCAAVDGPNINSATARVLDAAGIQTVVAPGPVAAVRSSST